MRRIVSFIVVVVVVFLSYQYRYFPWKISDVSNFIVDINRRNRSFRVLYGNVDETRKRVLTTTCSFPDPDPYHSSMKPHMKKISKKNCVRLTQGSKHRNRIFVQERGRNVIRKVHPINAKCCYKAVKEGKDEFPCIPITENVTVIPNKSEYSLVEISCTGKETYQDIFVFVNYDDVKSNKSTGSIKDDNRKAAEHDKLSVIILGLDNVSRMHFLRSLPKSHKYLTNELSATVMKGYTKIADNSLPNVLPFLAGKTFDEFTETCGKNKTSHLDNCPFIFRNFKAAGYTTSMAEDEINISLFNMYWDNPFIKYPTDYYFLPYSRYMEDNHMESVYGWCYGTRLSFQVLLDNIENMATKMTEKNRHFFDFTWTTKLSHNDFNTLRLLDTPILNFLKYLHSSHILNRTALIILGDHGERGMNVQMTSLGKTEMKMPALYMVLPPWFKSKYPVAYGNLRENGQTLTSGFDVHETLKAFTNLSQLNSIEYGDKEGFKPVTHQEEKHISLFHRIPRNRTCAEARIPLHWCTCKGAMDEAPINDPMGQLDVVEAGKAAVIFMNEKLKAANGLCQNLSLHKITEAFTLDYATIYPNVKKALRIYFYTVPGKAFFSATIVQGHKGEWSVPHEVVRINQYKGQNDCVSYFPYESKMYCFCKK